VKVYSFISGDAAGACDARPATAHAPIANLVNSRVIVVMKVSPPIETPCWRDPLLTVSNAAKPPMPGIWTALLKACYS
jgi:hypothetical protein